MAGCNICGLELTGAMLNASPIVHIVRAMEQTSTGRLREIELRYGGVPRMGPEDRPGPSEPVGMTTAYHH